MSRIAYDGRLIRVVVEQWHGDEREIVEHPGAVAVVAVDAEDHVVLVRQFRAPARAEVLELPAGTLDQGEGPLECARRELREETGLHGGRWAELASFWSTPGFCRERVTVFLAEDLEEGEPSPSADEELELVRRPVAEVANGLDEIEDAKTLVGLLLLLWRRTLG
jgi:ADP-ribose pyrophosphatase